MAKKIVNLVSKRNSLRTHRQIFTLNDEENKALNRYITKYKVQNKSKFIREALMITIIKKNGSGSSYFVRLKKLNLYPWMKLNLHQNST
jgi:hypothetical protein